jgi:hypothetical protein
VSDPQAEKISPHWETLHALGALDGEDLSSFLASLAVSEGEDKKRRIQNYRLAEMLSLSCDQSAPPLAVKKRLMDRFRVSTARPTESVAFSRPQPGAMEKWASHFGQSRHNFSKMLCWVLFALLLLSLTGWAWTFQSWYALREASRFETHRIQALSDSLSAQTANLALFSASSLRSTELSGTPGHERARGRLIWESLHGRALLSLSGLEKSEGYYRVWISSMDKVLPVATLPAGVKLPTLTPLQPLPEKYRRRITSVTVTLEASPNGIDPTGTPLMMGMPLQ